MTNLDSILKSSNITLPTKVPLDKTMVFPVVMYRCESWTIKKAKCRRIDAFELCVRVDSWVPWTARRSNPKGNQSWMFIGRTDAEAETPILWPPGAKNWLTGKDPDAGKLKAGGEGDDTGWDGWMASPTQWTWVGDGQGSLVCWSPWCHKESDTTEWLNWRRCIHTCSFYYYCLNSILICILK